MKISQDLKQEILEEIRMPKYQDGDIIIKEAAEELGLSEITVNRRLDEKVAEGKLLKLTGVLPNGRIGNLYRPIVPD